MPLMKSLYCLLTTLLFLPLSASAFFFGGGGKGSWPDPLYISFIPVAGGSAELETSKLVDNFLTAELDHTVNTATASNYEGVINQLVDNISQVGYLGPKSFVEATGEVALEPLVVEIGPSGQPGFIPVLVALKSSGLASIDDALDGSKSIAFTDPDATAGYLVPTSFLKEKTGGNLESVFKKVSVSGSHLASIKGLADGTYDIIATDDIGLSKFAESAGLSASDIVILHQFDLAPGSTFVIRADAPDSLKTALRTALMKMGTDTEIQKALGILGFAPAAADGKIYFDFIESFSK